MQVSKWGNSLAIRLPASVVRELQLKDGDHVEIAVDPDASGGRKLAIRRDPRVEEALARIRQLRRRLPAGFKFNREDAHARTAKPRK
jgi:antitoxin MazE